MKKRFNVLVLIAVLLLSGCSVYKVIPPGEAQLGSLKVNNPTDWSQFKQGRITYWTYDGVLLNKISVGNIKDGGHILGHKVTEENSGFVYQSSLSLSEVVELYIDSLTTAGMINTELLENEYTQVSGFDAVKFSYQFDTNENLKYRVLALFIQDGQSIHSLFCEAPLEHYFPKYENEFHKIIDSATLVL